MAKPDLPDWAESIGRTVAVRVTPKASRERIEATLQPDGSFLLKIYVTVVPEDGKANAAVLKLLAKTLKLAPSQLTIISGHASRDKKIAIAR